MSKSQSSEAPESDWLTGRDPNLLPTPVVACDECQALATALFARTDVVGFERMEHELTPDAIELGLGAALPAVFEIVKEGRFGRGERS